MGLLSGLLGTKEIAPPSLAKTDERYYQNVEEAIKNKDKFANKDITGHKLSAQKDIDYGYNKYKQLSDMSVANTGSELMRGGNDINSIRRGLASGSNQVNQANSMYQNLAAKTSANDYEQQLSDKYGFQKSLVGDQLGLVNQRNGQTENMNRDMFAMNQYQAAQQKPSLFSTMLNLGAAGVQAYSGKKGNTNKKGMVGTSTGGAVNNPTSHSYQNNYGQQAPTRYA